MAGFVNLHVPVLLRRLDHDDPSTVLLAVGFSPTSALVLSQVFLSFGIPFALIPLVHLTSRHDLMGTHVNKRLTTWTAVAIATLISLLNVFLLYQYFSGS